MLQIEINWNKGAFVILVIVTQDVAEKELKEKDQDQLPRDV